RYAYEPDRARALMREAGWVPGPDGQLQNAMDGRKFHTAIRGGPGRAAEAAALSDYWRKLGLEVDEYVLNPAEYRDPRVRANYPGWYNTTLIASDQFLTKMEGPGSSPENGWTGNSSGYENPRAQSLIDVYR